MKKHLRQWAIAAATAAAALAFSSCAYDPYYSSVGGSYSSGYGEGYGYGGSNFSTSFFVSTGDPRWGYDPHCYSYYDYHRRCYYDPYLNGYYPVGYRPPVVYGVPHPYGYSRGYCPPPRYVTNVTVVNYRNREAAYRSTNYGWAKQVRQQPVRQRVQDQHPSRGTYYGRPDNDSHPSRSNGTRNQRSDQYSSRSQGNSYTRQPESRYSQGVKPGVREQQGRLPQSYNTPVTRNQPRPNYSGRQESADRSQSRQFRQPNIGNSRGNNHRNAPSQSRGSGNQNRKEESRPNKDGQRGVRSLGQG